MDGRTEDAYSPSLVYPDAPEMHDPAQKYSPVNTSSKMETASYGEIGSRKRVSMSPEIDSYFHRSENEENIRDWPSKRMRTSSPPSTNKVRMRILFLTILIDFGFNNGLNPKDLH